MPWRQFASTINRMWLAAMLCSVPFAGWLVMSQRRGIRIGVAVVLAAMALLTVGLSADLVYVPWVWQLLIAYPLRRVL